MSSHHFVKEGQEPAVVLVEPFSDAVAAVLEWSPLVIGLYGAIDSILINGLKADVVITPQSAREEVIKKLQHQFPITFLHTDQSDQLHTALQYLQTLKQYAVMIWVNDPVSYFDRVALFQNKLAISVMNASMKWSLIKSERFTKWFASGENLKLHGSNLVYEGLAKIDKETYRVNITGPVSISSDQHFWIGESLK
ncbi:MAG TPA: hypothetical protein VD927_19415 [Chryseosolibacter sp.]|nr:hypothetical protein [Chryseosolibacter sp.]